MLVVSLADAMVDRLFAGNVDADDVLAFRAEVSAGNPGLASVMALAMHRRDGPWLAVKERQIPIEDYGALSVEDFMVSLYNDRTVQRLMVTGTSVQDWEAEQVLSQALAELDRLVDSSR